MPDVLRSYLDIGTNAVKLEVVKARAGNAEILYFGHARSCKKRSRAVQTALSNWADSFPVVISKFRSSPLQGAYSMACEENLIPSMLPLDIVWRIGDNPLYLGVTHKEVPFVKHA